MGKENESIETAEMSGIDIGLSIKGEVPYAEEIIAFAGHLVAMSYLESRGYEILERNFLCKAGMIDLIARIEDCVCFIEVKTCTEAVKGCPEEETNLNKLDRVERVAACYLKEHAAEELRVRFDEISVTLHDKKSAYVRYHKNAYNDVW